MNIEEVSMWALRMFMGRRVTKQEPIATGHSQPVPLGNVPPMQFMPRVFKPEVSSFELSA